MFPLSFPLTFPLSFPLTFPLSLHSPNVPSLRRLSRGLGEAGHPASPPTVRRLLDAQGYRLHANTKQLESSGYSGSQVVHRLMIGMGVSR